jgi:glycosyltransferase involved in cell wall biosynthesis
VSRIALFVPAPWERLSGGYAYDRRMVAGLRRAGHDVAVIALAGVHPLADAHAEAAAGRGLETLTPETIAVIDGLALPAFAPHLAAITGRAIGLIHHPTALETGFSEADRADLRALECRLMPRLKTVIATSPETASRLEKEFGVAPSRLRIVTPGTDPAPRSVGSGGPGTAILAVGALIPRKGHDVLLRALAPLFDLDFSLTIAGEATSAPTHAASLRDLAAALGIAAKVTFAGEVDDPTLDRLWQGADLFALATHWEGYGMAVAEALARGLPVAVCTGGAAAAEIPENAGVFAAPGDHEQLSKALRRLIFDADLRRLMAENAWRGGQRLPGWDKQITAFAQALGIE